jgi:hypothetical protein
MILTGLETALLAGAVSTGSLALGSVVKSIWQGNQCSRCGIDDLRREIQTQSKMIRLLAEKAGVTVAQQLEIEERT